MKAGTAGMRPSSDGMLCAPLTFLNCNTPHTCLYTLDLHSNTIPASSTCFSLAQWPLSHHS